MLLNRTLNSLVEVWVKTGTKRTVGMSARHYWALLCRAGQGRAAPQLTHDSAAATAALSARLAALHCVRWVTRSVAHTPAKCQVPSANPSARPSATSCDAYIQLTTASQTTSDWPGWMMPCVHCTVGAKYCMSINVSYLFPVISKFTCVIILSVLGKTELLYSNYLFCGISRGSSWLPTRDTSSTFLHNVASLERYGGNDTDKRTVYRPFCVTDLCRV